jgi:hypothetical protein
VIENHNKSECDRVCQSRCLLMGVSQEHCTRICHVVWSHFGHMCVHLKGCSVGGHTQARVNVATATRASCLGADYWSRLGACDSSWGLCTSPWPRLWHSPWPPGAFVRCRSHHAFFSCRFMQSRGRVMLRCAAHWCGHAASGTLVFNTLMGLTLFQYSHFCSF